MFDLHPTPTAITLFSVGWLAGWVLLARSRSLPSSTPTRSAVAVIVPARDEARFISSLIGSLVAQAGPRDEIVVVDDHSTDDTPARALRSGARVIAAPPPPPGWLGKPHACHVGAATTTAPILVFLDADVTPTDDLLDRLAAAVDAAPQALVSVQPSHRPGSTIEQLSAVFNIAALMGSGVVAITSVRSARRDRSQTPGHPHDSGHPHDPGRPHDSGRSRHPRRRARPEFPDRHPIAFGPVLACRRSAYVAVGGHAHPSVRSTPTEDLALAHRFGRTTVFTGPSGPSVRMYPDGLGSLLNGWTRSLASGIGAGPPLATIATIAWVWSLCGGWLASPWFYVASMIQFVVLAGRTGRFALWTAFAHPLLAAVFTTVTVRAVFVAATGRSVAWKGRAVRARERPWPARPDGRRRATRRSG